MEKRWWLWEWTRPNGRRFLVVQDFPSSAPGVTCTEVRLVPVEDDGLVTLRVPPDSLEAAIAGTRREEKWVVKDKPWLQLRILEDGSITEFSTGSSDYGMEGMEPSGWHRVEEPPLECPAC